MGLVEISHVQGHTPVTIFHLQDRVNLGNFAELEELAKEAYSYGVRDMVIDLSKTPSMTSIGIRALIVIYRMLSQEDGKHLKLASATPQISEMLEIAGVTQHIEIFATVEDAVNSFPRSKHIT
jgi:anti-anti-sigma factor